MASFLRRFVPVFVEQGFLPPSFVANAQKIRKLTVHPREPKIPSPAEMEEFLKECEQRDRELGQLLRFLAYSGARKGTVFERQRAVTWEQVDLEAGDIVLQQKGDVRRRVPMGPQLQDVLRQWKISRPPDEVDPRVFPFGSGRENRAPSNAVLQQRPVLLAGFVRIAEEPDEQLADPNSGIGCVIAAAAGHQWGLLSIQPHFLVMRNVFIVYSRIDRAVRATPKPAPAVVRIRIFGVENNVYCFCVTKKSARNAEDEFIVLIGRLEQLGLFSFAPLPALPSANETGDAVRRASADKSKSLLKGRNTVDPS